MKDKILGNPITKEFEGVKATMQPVPRIQLMKLMNRFDLTDPSGFAGLGAELAPLCILDIDGPVKTKYTNVKVGRAHRRVVNEEVFDDIPFETLSLILMWVVEQHFVTEGEQGN